MPIISRNPLGGWSAIDEEVGVASQGETRREALENLDEAVELTLEVREEVTDAPTPNAPWFENDESQRSQ